MMGLSNKWRSQLISLLLLLLNDLNKPAIIDNIHGLIDVQGPRIILLIIAI